METHRHSHLGYWDNWWVSGSQHTHTHTESLLGNIDPLLGRSNDTPLLEIENRVKFPVESWLSASDADTGSSQACASILGRGDTMGMERPGQWADLKSWTVMKGKITQQTWPHVLNRLYDKQGIPVITNRINIKKVFGCCSSARLTFKLRAQLKRGRWQRIKQMLVLPMLM